LGSDPNLLAPIHFNPCPNPDGLLDVTIDVYKMTISKHIYCYA